MKAIEFESRVTPDGRIAIPAEIAEQLTPGEPLHIVLHWDLADEDDVWRTQGRERFEAAYAPEDAVYHELMNESLARIS